VNTVPHATLILFDQLNMQFSDRGYVSNAITHALEQFESGDNLYLYLITVNGELYPVHALPGSEGDTAAKDGAWTHNIQTTLSAALRATLGQRPIELDIDSRVRSTFATLSVVASRLAGIPGRKTIVWLTHGVPISLSPARTLNGRLDRLLSVRAPLEQHARPRRRVDLCGAAIAARIAQPHSDGHEPFPECPRSCLHRVRQRRDAHRVRQSHRRARFPQ
jgi:hypothetical protein